MEFSATTLNCEALLRFTRLVQNECDKSQEVHGQATQMGVNIMIAPAGLRVLFGISEKDILHISRIF